jgi:hypothetical protein
MLLKIFYDGKHYTSKQTDYKIESIKLAGDKYICTLFFHNIECPFGLM